MLLGPIFRVELVTMARRRRYFLLRVVYGALMLMVLWSAYTQTQLYAGFGQDQTSIQSGQMLATAFFQSFSWLQIFAILAVGPAMAVGTIASERERRTIEYLFTTDLANHEIVLGKIIARLCLLGQFVLVGLPILFVFRMLGGISTDLLLGSFILAGSAAILLTTLSVCVSVWSPTTREATTRVYFLLAAFLTLPGLIGLLGSMWGPNSSTWNAIGVPVLDFANMLNPVYVLGAAFIQGIDLPLLFEAVAMQLTLAFLATLLAISAVRRVHLRESTRGVKSKRRGLLAQLPKWRRPLGDSPMVWKEVFSPSSSSSLGLIGRIAMAIFMAVVFAQIVSAFVTSLDNGNSGSFFENYTYQLSMITGLLGSGMLVLLATSAAGSITTEKERDCWLALLATPLTGKEILWGKACGCLYGMRWPLGLLAFAWMLGIIMVPSTFFAAAATLVTLLGAFWSVVNLGLLYSLRSLTTMRAIGATLATLIFCGGGYLFCCCTVMMGSGGDEGMALLLIPCLPYLLGFPASGLSENALAEFSPRGVPFYFAYAAGTLGYLIAGFLIFSSSTYHFDEASGRTSTRPDGLAD